MQHRNGRPLRIPDDKEIPMPCLRSLIVLLLACSVSVAADWPQWLGPKRDASTTEKVAPWKGSLKLLWRQPVGEGNSSPVVAGGRVFLHTKVAGKNEERLTAYDAASGEPIWHKDYPRAAQTFLFGNGPRATPAVAGDKVYTHGITGIVTCFAAKDGERLWHVDTVRDFKARSLFFGASCSPLVEKDLVLLNVGAKGASVVAFDQGSGKVRWKELDDGASYASPIIFGKGAQRQVVFLTQLGLVSLNAKSGELFWRSPLKDKMFESSTTPLKAGDVLVGSSITVGTVGLRLETQDDKPAVAPLWKNPDLTCYFATPVAVGEHIYMVTGTMAGPFAKTKSSASLRCVEVRTGKELWKKDNVGTYHASLLRTGDNKLLMLEERGALVLLDPNPKEYRELARAKVCGQTWAHAAVADGRLYVRDGKELRCLQLAP
jgi:outer membrane protein assembly factor BamB